MGKIICRCNAGEQFNQIDCNRCMEGLIAIVAWRDWLQSWYGWIDCNHGVEVLIAIVVWRDWLQLWYGAIEFNRGKCFHRQRFDLSYLYSSLSRRWDEWFPLTTLHMFLRIHNGRLKCISLPMLKWHVKKNFQFIYPDDPSIRNYKFVVTIFINLEWTRISYSWNVNA